MLTTQPGLEGAAAHEAFRLNLSAPFIDGTTYLSQAGRRSDEEDMDLDQIDIRALERVSPRTNIMAPEQVLHTPATVLCPKFTTTS